MVWSESRRVSALRCHGGFGADMAVVWNPAFKYRGWRKGKIKIAGTPVFLFVCLKDITCHLKG